MCLVMVAAGAWILVKVRPRLAALDAEEVPAETAPDKLAGPDDEAEAKAGADEPSEPSEPAGGGAAREGERWRAAATKMSALLDPASAPEAAPVAATDAGERASDGADDGDGGDPGDERS
jgi:hypothetical protein